MKKIHNLILIRFPLRGLGGKYEKRYVYGASNLIFENAKSLRNNLTHAETILWGYLKQKPLGHKFRRQHPLGSYVADFYCHTLKLVIEVDGAIHEIEEVKTNDLARQKNIESEGIMVIRFTNEEVILHLEKVMNTIEQFIINDTKPPLGGLGVNNISPL